MILLSLEIITKYIKGSKDNLSNRKKYQSSMKRNLLGIFSLSTGRSRKSWEVVVY